MRIIFKYQIRQFRNYWRSIPLRIKIEIFILLAIFYLYGTEKLADLFHRILNEPRITPIGLNAFLQQVILFPLLCTLPFIFFRLLPRQRGIQILRLLPLGTGETAALLLVHFWKYQLIFFLLTLPVFSASVFTTGVLSAPYLLAVVIIMPVLFLYLLQLLCSYIEHIYLILLIYFLITGLYFVIFVFLYLHNLNYMLFQLVILAGLILPIYRSWPVMWENWDLILDRFQPSEKKAPFKFSQIRYDRLSRYIPLSIRPVFIKEILAQVRTSNYLRLKVITLLVLPLGILVLSLYVEQNFKCGITLLFMILIWWHYGTQFNEKYVLPESRSFIKTQPLRFYQYWLPKFLSEFIYTSILIFLVLVSLLGQGENWNSIITSMLIMLLFSALILFTTIIFRTLFYDKPRLAGYAYHFLILFCLVMTINFYFIGPVITLILFTFFFIKSYRVFSQ